MRLDDDLCKGAVRKRKFELSTSFKLSKFTDNVEPFGRVNNLKAFLPGSYLTPHNESAKAYKSHLHGGIFVNFLPSGFTDDFQTRLFAYFFGTV